LVGEANDCVVLLSATTAAAPGLSNARIARRGSLGDVDEPSAVHRQMQPAAQMPVICK
ncbi:MAG: hypothetical protein QOH09_1770, partial [Pseudonocardiales bacterium]|nr:hypothetical protein [Pseudonocardiales bacterium]